MLGFREKFVSSLIKVFLVSVLIIFFLPIGLFLGAKYILVEDGGLRSLIFGSVLIPTSTIVFCIFGYRRLKKREWNSFDHWACVATVALVAPLVLELWSAMLVKADEDFGLPALKTLGDLIKNQRFIPSAVVFAILAYRRIWDYLDGHRGTPGLFAWIFRAFEK